MFSSLTASGSEMRILLSSLTKDYSFRVKIRNNTINQARRGFRLLPNNSCQPCVLAINNLWLNVPSYGVFECVQQHRYFSTPPIYPFSLKGEKLMPLFPHVLSPWRPLFQYILRTVIDKDFTTEYFTSNSLLVIELLCSKLASDSLSDLIEVVTPDCLAELKENASRLNSQQKEVLRVQPRSRIGIKILDVYFDGISNLFSPNQIGVNIIVHGYEILTGGSMSTMKIHYVKFHRKYGENMEKLWMVTDWNVIYTYSLFK